MKAALLVCQSLCLLSLLLSHSWKRYKCLTLLLPFAILATAGFQADAQLLRVWYVWYAVPVAILRLFSTLEVSYWQTHQFRYWARLTGACFLLAMFYSLSVWASSPGGNLETWVQLRRYPQLWAAAFFLVLELFWVCSGCWRGSREDWAAVAFAGMCLNHGAVSLVGQLTRWPGLSWWRTAGWSWGVEAAGWLALAVVMVWRRNGKHDGRNVAEEKHSECGGDLQRQPSTAQEEKEDCGSKESHSPSTRGKVKRRIRWSEPDERLGPDY